MDKGPIMSATTLRRLSGLALMLSGLLALVGNLANPGIDIALVDHPLWTPMHALVLPAFTFALLGLPGLYASIASAFGHRGLDRLCAIHAAPGNLDRQQDLRSGGEAGIGDGWSGTRAGERRPGLFVVRRVGHSLVDGAGGRYAVVWRCDHPVDVPGALGRRANHPRLDHFDGYSTGWDRMREGGLAWLGVALWREQSDPQRRRLPTTTTQALGGDL